MNRTKTLVLTALALVAACFTTAHASKPSTSDQLRVTRVVSKAGASPAFINTDSLFATAYEGTVKRLLVVDWVSFQSTAGVVAEDFSIFYSDDNSNTVEFVKQTVAANTTETIFLNFPAGYPLFNLRSQAGSVLKTRDDPCTGGANFFFAALSSLSGLLTVGYHMEAVSDRLP